MAGTSINNGVNVDALLAAREALKGAPEAAKFTWRASCKWKNGTHSESTVQGFHGLGAEQKHKTEFSFETDHPEIFSSEDLRRHACQLVLVGATSCLTAGVAAVAQNRGVQLRSVEAKLEGSMDIRAFSASTATCGTATTTSRSFNIDADASKRTSKRSSRSRRSARPCDIVTNPTNVTVEVLYSGRELGVGNSRSASVRRSPPKHTEVHEPKDEIILGGLGDLGG